MKKTINTLAALAITAFTLSSQAAETTTVLGQCTLTKQSVLKSKSLPKGSQELNEVANFQITKHINTEEASYYDDLRLEIQSANVNDFAVLAKKSYDDPVEKPMSSVTKVSANDAKKLDLFIESESYEKHKLVYDYKSKTGRFETRTKINGFGGIFGIKTTTNDHIVLYFKDCTFQGPINLQL